MNTTREFLIKTALALFLAKGYKAVTLRELVSSSGLSKGAFYHYFASKEAIFLAAVQSAFAAMAPDYSSLPQHSLRAFYQGFLAQLATQLQPSPTAPEVPSEAANPNFYYLIFDALRYFPEMREQVAQFEDQELTAWSAVMAQARQQGELTSSLSAQLSDQQLAQLFIFTGDGISLRQVYLGDLAGGLPRIQALWDSLYQALTNPNPKADPH